MVVIGNLKKLILKFDNKKVDHDGPRAVTTWKLHALDTGKETSSLYGCMGTCEAQFEE